MAKQRTKYNDGLYEFAELKNAMGEEFSSEKDFCDYIELNIHDFTSECLGLQYASHIREYQIGGKARKYKESKRVDFLITTKCGKHICVECKRPTHVGELASAVGQVLGYLSLFEIMGESVHSAFIVSTKIDWYLPVIVSKYNLPIGFIAIDKSKHLTFQNGRK